MSGGGPDLDGAARLPEQLGAMRRWLSGLESDMADLSEPERLAVVTAAEELKGAVAAVQARTVDAFVAQREADAAGCHARGETSAREASRCRAAARSEVALARRSSPGQADRYVSDVRAWCSDLPETMSALARGDVSEARARIVARETSCLSSADRAEADRRLAPELTRLGDRALAGAAQRVVIDLDQGSVVRRRSRAVANRCVSVRPAPDGMAWLSVLGPLVDVVGAHASLLASEKARWVSTGDPEADARRAEDDRSRGAWMADTALERISGRAEGQAQPVEVDLVMTDSALFARAEDGAAEVPGWGAVPSRSARQHVLRLLDELGHADETEDGATALWLRRLYTSPDGRDLVAMDSARRCFAGGLRRLLELRDPTCRVPWCDAPTREIDHAHRAADGGATSTTNGWGLCQRHNLDKEAGWSAEVVSTGTAPPGGPHEIRLTTPTGRAHTCPAPPLLGPGRDPTRSARPPNGSRIEVHYESVLAHAA